MTTIFTVANTTDLNNALQATDQSAFSNTAFTISLAANITLTQDLWAVNLANGNTLTIDGSNGSGGAFTLDGNNQHRGLLVTSGFVTIRNLNIANATAGGGAGGSAYAAGDGRRVGRWPVRQLHRQRGAPRGELQQ
jgi:hypothetical protein